MIRMSFFDGTLKRDVAKKVILETKKPIKYTFGIAASNRIPSTYKKPITKEEAIKTIDTEGLLDIDEYEDYIHLNGYHANDLF
jgi:hypothetical protein